MARRSLWVDLEWGPNGVDLFAGRVDLVVVVDVLRFTTVVDVAVARGTSVVPAVWAPTGDADYARLSPSRLLRERPEPRMEVPSPNGSTLTLRAATAGVPVVAGCLRNASAVASWVLDQGFGRIGLVPAGEGWPDGSFRNALEDCLGAAAVAAALDGANRTAEAESAARMWTAVRKQAPRMLHECRSGQELLGRRLADDIEIAADVDASACVPLLVDGAFVPAR